jgi:membrane protease YdiL (CAAX protease family)
VTLELLILSALSSAFLASFPRRSIGVDLGLALLALYLVWLNADFTRTQLWEQWPISSGSADSRGGVPVTLTVTLVILLLFLIAGIAIGYQGADWPGVQARILHPYIPTAILLYLPWAFLQQTLFQFYLFSRVRTLLPSLHPLGQSALNGLIFGLVHTTDIWIALPATLGGTLWSFLYLRYRRLWPLAVSHALIGTTFYYWVYGLDLASRWSAFLRTLLNEAQWATAGLLRSVVVGLVGADST